MYIHTYICIFHAKPVVCQVCCWTVTHVSVAIFKFQKVNSAYNKHILQPSTSLRHISNCAFYMALEFPRAIQVQKQAGS